MAHRRLPDPPEVTPGRSLPHQRFSATAGEHNKKILWAHKLGSPGFIKSNRFLHGGTSRVFNVYLDSAEGAETAFLSDLLDHRASLDSLLPASLRKPHAGAVCLKLGRVRHRLLKGLRRAGAWVFLPEVFVFLTSSQVTLGARDPTLRPLV